METVNKVKKESHCWRCVGQWVNFVGSDLGLDIGFNESGAGQDL